MTLGILVLYKASDIRKIFMLDLSFIIFVFLSNNHFVGEVEFVYGCKFNICALLSYNHPPFPFKSFF